MRNVNSSRQYICSTNVWTWICGHDPCAVVMKENAHAYNHKSHLTL